MASGHPKPDLGRIVHSPFFVLTRCDGPMDRHRTDCARLTRLPMMTKTRALREARAHAALTGHEVTLVIQHTQRVRPRQEA